MKPKHKKIIKVPRFSTKNIIYLIVLIVLLYFLRPWFHPLMMAFYTKPVLILLIISIILIAYTFKRKKYMAATVFLLFTIALFIVLGLNDVIMEKYIVKETTYNKISSLPDSVGVRMLPRAVARRYLEDSLQKSREKVGGLNIVNINDMLYWTAPRIPDGFILYFTQKVNGIMIADATKSNRETSLITKRLDVGEGIGITDSIYWKIFKKRYFINLGDVYYINKNDTILTIAPIIAYKFRFPVMIPYFDGVFILNEEGKIGKYSPEQITKIKEFTNNRAFPEELARLYVDAYKYNLGILNAWFLHEDQIEITDVYDQSNRQPFLMPTVDGLKWIIATEPYGESYGIFKIFLVDALSGKIDVLELNEDQTLTGPVRVVSYVKKKFPTIDWSTAKVVEPRPYVINGSLYWLLSITPSDFAGISYTLFINSFNNEVITFENDEDVYKFIEQGLGLEEEPKKESEEEKRDKLIREIEEKLEELKKLK